MAAAAAISRLDHRLNKNYDFKHSYVVVLTLIDIVTCPIKLEHTYFMIMCNDQCYDFDNFDLYKTSEHKLIKRRIDSGYDRNTKFKVSRTGEDFDY